MPNLIPDWLPWMRPAGRLIWGVSLLIIEHVMQAIMALSHRLIVLHHGEKIAEGAPTEIVRNRRVVDAYLGEDFALA